MSKNGSNDPNRCEKHGERLEFYCHDDEAAVCRSCACCAAAGHRVSKLDGACAEAGLGLRSKAKFHIENVAHIIDQQIAALDKLFTAVQDLVAYASHFQSDQLALERDFIEKSRRKVAELVRDTQKYKEKLYSRIDTILASKSICEALANEYRLQAEMAQRAMKENRVEVLEKKKLAEASSLVYESAPLQDENSVLLKEVEEFTNREGLGGMLGILNESMTMVDTEMQTDAVSFESGNDGGKKTSALLENVSAKISEEELRLEALRREYKEKEGNFELLKDVLRNFRTKAELIKNQIDGAQKELASLLKALGRAKARSTPDFAHFGENGSK